MVCLAGKLALARYMDHCSLVQSRFLITQAMQSSPELSFCLDVCDIVAHDHAHETFARGNLAAFAWQAQLTTTVCCH